MLDKVENVTIVLASCIGLANIQEILGIIILVFQIILILYKSGKQIYDKIKSKKYDEIDDELEFTIKSLDELNKYLNKEDKVDDR